MSRRHAHVAPQDRSRPACLLIRARATGSMTTTTPMVARPSPRGARTAQQELARQRSDDLHSIACSPSGAAHPSLLAHLSGAALPLLRRAMMESWPKRARAAAAPLSPPPRSEKAKSLHNQESSRSDEAVNIAVMLRSRRGGASFTVLKMHGAMDLNLQDVAQGVSGLEQNRFNDDIAQWHRLTPPTK